jgi:DNA repair protein RecO (recombination protein O)
MEETYNFEAIILNRYAFRESDSRVILYSRERGKLELVARGTKKIKSKIAPHIEPFNLVEAMAVKGKSFDYLGSAISRSAFYNIKNDLSLLAVAGRIIKFLNQSVKEAEPDQQIFLLTKEALKILNDKKLKNEKEELVELFYIYKLMVTLGYKPDLFNCLHCHKKISDQKNYFDITRGGIICPNCLKNSLNYKRLTISSNLIKILRFANKNALSELMKLKINEILKEELDNFIRSFQQYHK